MGTNKPWKVFERLVSKFFKGKRIVPADDRTRGDVLHCFLYIECKAYLKKPPAIVKLYEDTATKAAVEGKRAVVCNKRVGTSDFLVTCAASDVEAVYIAIRRRMKDDKLERSYSGKRA